jgi:RluA family pseudouridine synthase
VNEPQILNLAAYRFAPLEGDLKPLRERLRSRGRTLGLRGTVLLAGEGINLFIAGPEEAARAFLEEIRELPGFAALEAKESWSVEQPFRRMLVRIKREIIAFGVDGVDPARRPSRKVAPRELKRWLDEGRPVTLLDTRNDYEVRLGTFRGALVPPMTHFREFPEAVRKLPAALKDEPVVMFCTGGIRCEKAGPFMEREGFRDVWQLDGGILKYFEEVGGAHYDGECFVFDHRTGLDPALAETPTTTCWRCQAPLSAEDQASPLYHPGIECPHCHRSPEQAMAERLAARQVAFRTAATPLPGSVPYDNFRPMTVPADCDGLTVTEFLARCFPHVPADEWADMMARGALVGPEHAPAPVTAGHRVKAGDRLRQFLAQVTEPPVNAAVRVLHEDDALIVLDKPAPLPMHPGGRFNRNTLQYLLERVYAPEKPRPAHRLDANTSGILVVCRTRAMAARVQPQFAQRTVDKSYLARVHGHPASDHFHCEAPISSAPGEVGSRAVGPAGDGMQDARTDFTVLRRHADGTALVEARPLTGRTNQIRLHLRHLGHPVVNDPVYGRGTEETGGRPPVTQTLDPTSPPLCLHAWRISLDHPLSSQRLTFEARPPAWADEVL